MSEVQGVLISGANMNLKMLMLGDQIEIKPTMTKKQKQMAKLRNDAVEVFPCVAKTDFNQYTLLIAPTIGEVFWFNKNKYDSIFDSNRLILVNKKYPLYRNIAYDNGIFYPSEGEYLLNGYSRAGSNYKCVKFQDEEGKSFIPRLHQLISLICFGEIALYALGGKGRKCIINHIDGDKGNCRLDNLEIGSNSHNARHFHDFIKEREILVVKNGEIVFADWYLKMLNLKNESYRDTAREVSEF